MLCWNSLAGAVRASITERGLAYLTVSVSFFSPRQYIEYMEFAPPTVRSLTCHGSTFVRLRATGKWPGES